MIGSAAAAFIFDLDGTLYSTSAMDDANRKAIVEAVAHHLAVIPGEADAKVASAIGQYDASSGRPSLYGAALAIGVPDRTIAHFQNRFVHPSRLLMPDAELADLLASLAKRAKLALLTNTRTAIAAKALKALGISQATFSEVWGGDLLSQPKPSSEDILKLCSSLDVQPADTISIGDRWGVDLAPAIEVGLMVRKVSGRDNLVDWLRQLLV